MSLFRGRNDTRRTLASAEGSGPSWRSRGQRHGRREVEPNQPPVQDESTESGTGGEYERGLRSRGDVTIWLSEDAIAAWIPPKNGTGNTYK